MPLAALDFSSYLLQAEASGAQVLGLANAGGDFINSLKAANAFGITEKMKPVALLAFISDIHSNRPSENCPTELVQESDACSRRP